MLALIVDAVLGEPPAMLHPVVWVGRAISLLERIAPPGKVGGFIYGAWMTPGVVGAATLAGAALGRLARTLPGPIGVFAEAWLLKTTFSVRSLIAAGHEVEALLHMSDLEAARQSVRALVSRDTTSLDERLLVSAAVESLAENTADSIVAPLLAYAVGGLPAAFAYRAINTLDAMIGYRGQYEYVGKVAAHLDDLANLLPARLSAGLLVVGGALAGGDVALGVRTVRSQHGRTASPNAGWPMSAMAGLLGVRLEKPGHYVLGDPSPGPDLAAVDHAAEIVKATTVLTGLLALAIAWLRRR
jgi:adenosylcobinamide-phosphate synthase